VHVDLGGRLAHVWLQGEQVQTSTLDLLGRGLTLFTVPSAWEGAAALVEADVPIDVRVLDRFTARALGVRGCGAMLVRPDGIVVGSWVDDDNALGALRNATVRALCQRASRPMSASSELAMPASPQHVA
jgi:hypothetical protein